MSENTETTTKTQKSEGAQNEMLAPKAQKSKRTFGIPRIFLLFFRTALFLFFFSLAQVIFFFIGNYQQFTDENQILILSVGAVSAVLLLFFSVFTLAISIFYTIKSQNTSHRVRHIVNIFFMILFVAVGAFFLASASTLVFFAG